MSRIQSSLPDDQVWRRAVMAHEKGQAEQASDLDDQAVQPLAAALLGMDAAAMALERGQVDEAQSMLLQSRTMVRSVTQRLRGLVFELRPPSLENGVVPAARSFVGRFRRDSGLHVAQSGDLPRLSPEAELALYRALQEAISNVALHAQAASVEVAFSSRGGRAILKVQDDGVGFDPASLPAANGEAAGGLASVRARLEWLGGGLEVRSIQGTGTLVTAHVPAA